MNRESDAFDVEPTSEVFQDAQAVRLQQSEMKIPIGVVRRVQHGIF